MWPTTKPKNHDPAYREEMIPRLRQQLNEQLMSDQLAVDLLSSYLRMDLSAQPWDQTL